MAGCQATCGNLTYDEFIYPHSIPVPSEFELIRKYFTRPVRHTRVGVGDDCAVLQVRPGMELAVSTDMLVSGTHFFPDADPVQLGHKVLAVNLSDIAAMGATPRWATLAAALPEANEAWIEAFARGFFALADQYEVDLIGGDTTRGPLNFCVQIMGEIPIGAALLRSGARLGDELWVSGELGDAALALAHLQGRARLDENALAICLPRLHTPTPRIALGLALRGIATSCIDVSDGLLQDLGHVLEMSKVGAELWLAQLPRSLALAKHADQAFADECVLGGGDDYELCFTAPPGSRAAVEALIGQTGVRLSRIGEIVSRQELRVLDRHGAEVPVTKSGFDHFARS
jgi:thiamine-monophosphate kinase